MWLPAPILRLQTNTARCSMALENAGLGAFWDHLRSLQMSQA